MKHYVQPEFEGKGLDEIPDPADQNPDLAMALEKNGRIARENINKASVLKLAEIYIEMFVINCDRTSEKNVGCI